MSDFRVTAAGKRLLLPNPVLNPDDHIRREEFINVILIDDPKY